MPPAPQDAAPIALAQRARALLRVDPDGVTSGAHAIPAVWAPKLEAWLEALPGRASALVGEEKAGALLKDLAEHLVALLSVAPLSDIPSPSLRWPHQGARYEHRSRWRVEQQARLPPTATLPAPELRLLLVECDTDLESERARLRRRYRLHADAPWQLDGDRLTVRLTLKASPRAGRAPSQRALNEEAERALLPTLPEAWRRLLGAPHPAGGSVLRRHLGRFTAPRAEDSFVTPTLSERLRAAQRDRALARLSEAQDEGQVAALWRHTRAVEALAAPLLRWRVEQEQLRLRLHQRAPLVSRSEWLVSVELLPEALQRDIAACPAQRAQWAARYKNEDLTPGFLVDTHVLPEPLRQTVRDAVPGLDGPLTHGEVYLGENASALRLLQARWAGRVDLCYIDPPYNTGGAKFAYRDMYHRDTWLTMMRDRLSLARALSTPEGCLILSIDDAELAQASALAQQSWGPELAKLIWDRNRKNDARYFSVGHEYMLVHAADLDALKASGLRPREPKPGLDEARARFQGLRARHGEDWVAIRREWMAWFDALPAGDPRRRMRRYTRVGPRGPYRDDGNINWPGGGGPRYEVLHPDTQRPCKLPRSGWRYPTPERFWEEVRAGRVVFGEDERTVPRIASYLFEGAGQVMPSVFYSYAQTAAQEFDAMFGARVFKNPKPYGDLARVLRYLGDPEATVLDFFAGSGGAGHAALHLNRQDGGRRRFVLVEGGLHGQTVLLPRLAKAAYADDWEGGAPREPAPTPTVIHVSHLETPEDLALGLGAPLRAERLGYPLQPQAAALLPELVIRRPWSWRRRALVDGAPGEGPVDWVESVNARLGLRVRAVERPLEGALFVWGDTSEGAPALVVWRDLERAPEERLLTLLSQRPQDAQLRYINGGLPRALSGWAEVESLLRDPPA